MASSDVIIIGAGAAGLKAAEALTSSCSGQHGKRPFSVIVLEGQNRIGGRILSDMWTEHGKEVPVELGAAFIHGCDPDGERSRKDERRVHELHPAMQVDRLT